MKLRDGRVSMVVHPQTSRLSIAAASMEDVWPLKAALRSTKLLSKHVVHVLTCVVLVYVKLAASVFDNIILGTKRVQKVYQ